MSRIGRFIPFVVLVGTLVAACGTSESASRDVVSTTSEGVDEMSAGPDLAQFAREYTDVIDVIGVGTQDDLARAEEFVTDYGTASFTMLSDESYLTWTSLGVTSSPTAGLFSADGEFIAGWVGPLPEDDVVRLAEASIAETS